MFLIPERYNVVFDPSKTANEQVLILLHHAGHEVDVNMLRDWIEYKNPSRFNLMLSQMHRQRLIEYNGTTCLITPIGIKSVETLIS